MGRFAGRLIDRAGLIGGGLVGPMSARLFDRAGLGRSLGWPGLVWGRLFGRLTGRLAPLKYGGKYGAGRVGRGFSDWPGLTPFDWGGAGRLIDRAGWVGPRSCPDRGKTGGFCNTLRKQNDKKTDTRQVRTRVYPVILYGRTVILGPEKSISQLRISEKKIGSKKMPSQTRQNFPLSETWQENAKKLVKPSQIFQSDLTVASMYFRQF